MPEKLVHMFETAKMIQTLFRKHDRATLDKRYISVVIKVTVSGKQTTEARSQKER